ncbi:MAG: NAD(P)H-dependent oxidoreductase [Myxococcaceae bacterium]|nr:NAD(P)H-dependent oxidoreductase [Myxococcaceae bacterium]
MAGRRILVQLAHPVLERSRVNRRLAEAAREVEGVTLNDLYERYPSLRIDVRREQRLLAEHDVIVFQHPFYWYSVPALLKEWQDLVLEHGWAYGAKGHHLDGKVTLNAVSTGGPKEAYQPEGYNRFTMRQLLSPWEATARLCRMRFLAPFVVHGALGFETAEQVAPQVHDYRRLLEALRDDAVDLERAAAAQLLNAPLDAVLEAKEVSA